jgi:hypothetical protein
MSSCYGASSATAGSGDSGDPAPNCRTSARHGSPFRNTSARAARAVRARGRGKAGKSNQAPDRQSDSHRNRD